MAASGGFEAGSQGGIAGDAPGGSDAMHANAAGGANGFFDEDLDNRGLHTRAQIGNFIGLAGGVRMIREIIFHGGFEAAKAEVVTGIGEERTRKFDGFGISGAGEAIQLWTAGVGEIEQFGGFVEAFASGVIDGAAEHEMIKFSADMHEQSVAAADDEGKVRFEKLELGASPGNPRRIKMCFVMVDAVERPAEREGGGLGGLETGHERGGQAGALGGGEDIDLRNGDAGTGERGADHREEILEMLAGGEFGNDSTILGVESRLRGDDIGQDFAIANDGGAGFVAGSFDPENDHWAGALARSRRGVREGMRSW